MRFRVTSVTCSESGAPLRDVTVRIEDWLNASLGDGDFGVGVNQFTIVAISVDDDPNENSRWTKAHDKTGRFKNQITGESVSYISVSITISPEIVITSDSAELLARFCACIIYRLEQRPARVPMGFDYARCAKAISKALAVYVHPVV